LSKKRELDERKETSPNKRKPEAADSSTIVTTYESETDCKTKEEQTTDPKSNQIKYHSRFVLQQLSN
jgi:hypothetical protein